MEKLQKALQKARNQRSAESGVVLRDTPGSAALAQADTDVDQLWSDLPRVELNAGILEKHRIVTVHADTRGTQFDIMRTKILLTMRKNSWTRLGLTSPTTGCGKTTTACNLAIGGARNSDLRMMMFELDLRSPSMSKMLGLPTTHNISRLLSKEIQFQEQALCYNENVAIAAAYDVSVDPASILQNKSTQEVLDGIETLYNPDLVIFDLPPLLGAGDTRAILKDMDCVLLVAQAGKTTVSQIDVCEREIGEQTNVVGIVLNQCRDDTEDLL